MEREVDDPEEEEQPRPDRRVKNGGTTKTKHRVQGRIIFNRVAFPELLHELLDGNLLVKTKLGKAAFQWSANPDQPDQDPMENLNNYDLNESTGGRETYDPNQRGP